MSVRVTEAPKHMSACVFCATTIPPEERVCSYCVADLRKLYVAQRLVRDPRVSIADAVREAVERIDKLKLRRE